MTAPPETRESRPATTPGGPINFRELRERHENADNSVPMRFEVLDDSDLDGLPDGDPCPAHDQANDGCTCDDENTCAVCASCTCATADEAWRERAAALAAQKLQDELDRLAGPDASPEARGAVERVLRSEDARWADVYGVTIDAMTERIAAADQKRYNLVDKIKAVEGDVNAQVRDARMRAQAAENVSRTLHRESLDRVGQKSLFEYETLKAKQLGQERLQEEQWQEQQSGDDGSVNWDELFARPRVEPRWLIYPLIEYGKQVLMAVRGGGGKSLLAQEQSLLLAVKGVKVLYLDMENSADDLKERAEAMGHTSADRIAGNLIYRFSPSLPPLDTKAGGEALMKLITETGAELVVFDSAARFIAGPENESNTWNSLHRYVMVPMRKAGVAGLWLDHTGKDESRGARGTSAKRDVVDIEWTGSPISDGVRYVKGKRRNSHGPEAFSAVRVENPLRHEIRGEDMKPGLIESGQAKGERLERLVGVLDAAGVPVDAGRPTVLDALHKAGETAGSDLARQVIARRKQA